MLDFKHFDSPVTQFNNSWALSLISLTEILNSLLANSVIRETIWSPLSLRIFIELPSSASVLKAVVRTHSKIQMIKLRNPRMVTPSLSGMHTQHFFILTKIENETQCFQYFCFQAHFFMSENQKQTSHFEPMNETFLNDSSWLQYLYCFYIL